MLCFGVLDIGKSLQTKSLTSFIKIHSVIRSIHKIVKSDCYLPIVCECISSKLVCSWNFFERRLGKFTFHYSRTRIARTLCQNQYRVLIILIEFFLEWQVFHTKVVKKIKTRISFSVILFSKNRVIDDRMWKNIAGQDMSWMRYGACALLPLYLGLQTHTFGICNTFCPSTATMVA
jgi:hypothetical protein